MQANCVRLAFFVVDFQRKSDVMEVLCHFRFVLEQGITLKRESGFLRKTLFLS